MKPRFLPPPARFSPFFKPSSSCDAFDYWLRMLTVLSSSSSKQVTAPRRSRAGAAGAALTSPAQSPPFFSGRYLESALKPQSGFSEKAAAKNQIRTLLSHFFQQRDCHTLVRPLIDEEKLRSLSDQERQPLVAEAAAPARVQIHSDGFGHNVRRVQRLCRR